MVEEDGLRGITSNPTIFEKACGEIASMREEIKLLNVEIRKAGGN